MQEKSRYKQIILYSDSERLYFMKQAARLKKLVNSAEMQGIDYDTLACALHTTLTDAKSLVSQCKHVIEIKGRLYDEEAFVGFNDGATQMCAIIKKLMQKNSGYVSAAQLYSYVRAEMNMFLNDNDINDERSVYEIAQHLFEKNCFGGSCYSFSAKAHISEVKAAINNNLDIICRFAEEQGGVFKENDLTEYLAGIGIKAENSRNQMRLNKEPIFFFYEPGTIILAKSMKINDLWKQNLRQALNKLLNDADGYVILREIHPVWFETLPALPGHRYWTALLLQCVLRFYQKELGAKTISALDSQPMITLHAMLVKNDGVIQNFGDAVIVYLKENDITQRCFETEKLRKLLVKSGMIQGCELSGKLPKALYGDERFGWSATGENVKVRV